MLAERKAARRLETKITVTIRMKIFDTGFNGREKRNEPQHDKTYKMTCAPDEDSDQLGHPPSLIRVFACTQSVAKDPMFLHANNEHSDQTGGYQACSDSSLGAHVILLVLTCCGSNVNVGLSRKE